MIQISHLLGNLEGGQRLNALLAGGLLLFSDVMRQVVGSVRRWRHK